MTPDERMGSKDRPTARGGRILLALLGVATAALLATTRIPGPTTGHTLQTAAAVAATTALAVLSLLAAAKPGWTWTAPCGLAALVGALAVPASRQAVLTGIPAPLVALPSLLLALRLYPREDHGSPWVGPDRRGRLASLARLVPVGLGLAALAATPLLLAGFAPSRLAASRELSGPGGALVAGLLVAAALIALGLLGRALAVARRRARHAPTSEPSMAETSEVSP